MYGRIQIGNGVMMPLSYFTLDSLRNGSVEYVHQAANDRSQENTVQWLVAGVDSLTVVVRHASRDKQSQPKTVYVSVLPPNTQPPRPVNHRELRIITGRCNTRRLSSTLRNEQTACFCCSCYCWCCCWYWWLRTSVFWWKFFSKTYLAAWDKTSEDDSHKSWHKIGSCLVFTSFLIVSISFHETGRLFKNLNETCQFLCSSFSFKMLESGLVFVSRVTFILSFVNLVRFFSFG